MLIRVKPVIIKHTLCGVVFGSLFPVVAFLIEHYLIGKEINLSRDFIKQEPTLAIVTLAPLVLGLCFYFVGREHARLLVHQSRRSAVEAQLSDIALNDNLTGYGNRLSLSKDIRADASRAYGKYLLLIDLDKFKLINDTMGHATGDALLIALSKRIAAVLSAGEKLYRLGGDEFVVLSERTDAQDAINLAEQIIAEVDKPFDLSACRLVTGCSIGLASFREGERDSSPVLGRADLALYRAKEVFGSVHAMFNEEMSQEATGRMEMEQDIRLAFEEDQFFVEFQPIVDLNANRIRGFEALARWNHPTRGRISPVDFISVAEVSGIIVSLGERIMHIACEEAIKWPSPLSVSVNVSVEQFKHRDFYHQVIAVLDKTGLPPGRLILELTESVFVLDMNIVADVLRRLKMIGVRFALDDFGTGYSSINYLRQLSLDFMKLDKSFVDTIGSSEQDRELVKTVLQLGHHFDMVMTMEGVETEEQLDILRQHGADEVQGYFYAKPLPAAGVLAFLENFSANPPHSGWENRRESG